PGASAARSSSGWSQPTLRCACSCAIRGRPQRPFGDSLYLEAIRIRLDNPAAVPVGLTGSDAIFLAMGSVGLQASLQRIVIQAAAATRGLRQLVRLSVLNAGPDSLGINQRAHWSLDFAAQV